MIGLISLAAGQNDKEGFVPMREYSYGGRPVYYSRGGSYTDGREFNFPHSQYYYPGSFGYFGGGSGEGLYGRFGSSGSHNQESSSHYRFTPGAFGYYQPGGRFQWQGSRDFKHGKYPESQKTPSPVRPPKFQGPGFAFGFGGPPGSSRQPPTPERSPSPSRPSQIHPPQNGPGPFGFQFGFPGGHYHPGHFRFPNSHPKPPNSPPKPPVQPPKSPRPNLSPNPSQNRPPPGFGFQFGAFPPAGWGPNWQSSQNVPPFERSPNNEKNKPSQFGGGFFGYPGAWGNFGYPGFPGRNQDRPKAPKKSDKSQDSRKPSSENNYPGFGFGGFGFGHGTPSGHYNYPGQYYNGYYPFPFFGGFDQGGNFNPNPNSNDPSNPNPSSIPGPNSPFSNSPDSSQITPPISSPLPSPGNPPIQPIDSSNNSQNPPPLPLVPEASNSPFGDGPVLPVGSISDIPPSGNEIVPIGPDGGSVGVPESLPPVEVPIPGDISDSPIAL